MRYRRAVVAAGIGGGVVTAAPSVPDNRDGDPGAAGRTAMPGRGKRLFDLAVGDCRFPLGAAGRRARRFCGQRARPGGAYCDRHHAVAHVAAEAGAVETGAAEASATATGAAGRHPARLGPAE